MARLLMLLPILLLEFLTIFPDHVYPYCIYNDMADDTQLNVEQTNGQMVGVKNNPKRRFKHDGIPPSSKECCPKDNINCCKGWYDTHYVEFQAINTRAIKGMCGGYIVFKGTFKNVTYDNFAPGDVLLESQSWKY